VDYLRAPLILAALLALIPYFAIAFAGERVAKKVSALPKLPRLLLPMLLVVPYVMVSLAFGSFAWHWCALYLLLPVLIAVLLDRCDKGANWREFVVLAIVGLSVDLRWFEAAWPARMAVFNKVLLLDAGLYGFQCLRRLPGVGFDLRLRVRDWGTGLREFTFLAPIAIALGFMLGFLHWHAIFPNPLHAVLAWVFTFFFIAVPEEVFFRGWLQNLLEQRVGRSAGLLMTAILFGLSHFNKRAALFNCRYVVLASVAGIFYGRAWRENRRVGASAITHASIDTVWGLWLR
jgi:membrane protease YdiL (CAAX protease family)